MLNALPRPLQPSPGPRLASRWTSRWTLRWSTRWSAHWGRRTTLSDPSRLRAEVCPPSLRCAPEGSAWQRMMFWLMAPAPQDAAPPLNRLPGVRTEFLSTLSDIGGEEIDALRQRIRDTRSLRELWHTRAEVYRAVGVAYSQAEAEQRVAQLNRHFPTRAPRSQFATL